MRWCDCNIALALLIGCIAGFAADAVGQTWPNKPMRLIMPFPPGGPTDLVGRAAGTMLSDALGQPVIVDNRPGGNGTVGVDVLAKSAPDGYTVGLTAITLATAPHLGKVPFDSLNDFSPICNLVSMTPLIVANPALPVSRRCRTWVRRCCKARPASSSCMFRTKARRSRSRTCSPARRCWIFKARWYWRCPTSKPAN
jgi:hypothetical protein